MPNLSMGLRGRLARSIGWSTFAPLIATYPVDKVIRSLNNWDLVDTNKLTISKCSTFL